MPNRIAALAATIRAEADIERDRRATRAAEAKRLADRTTTGQRTDIAVCAIRAIHKLDREDVLVLLQAIAEGVSRHDMHIEDRRQLVDELHGQVEVMAEQIEEQAAWHGEVAA